MSAAFPENLPALPAPPRYCPWQRNPDPLDTGLYRFGHDFGNGILDRQLFQFDCLFAGYRENLIANRAEQLDRYVREQDFSGSLQRCINLFVIEQLHDEHPQWFQREQHNGMIMLNCALSGESLQFSPQGEFLASNSSLSPAYLDGLDALASQCQEDIAVLQRDPDGHYRLKALHLNCPNHWGADSRIGMDFDELHVPVPGFARRHTQTHKLLDGLLRREPYTRFVWGMSANRQLNQHPAHVNQQAATGDALQLRIERQVLWGIPEQAALLFTIRTVFLSASELDKVEEESLCAAIANMPAALLHYKASGHVQQLVKQFCSKHP